MLLKGIAASPGVAIGKAFVYEGNSEIHIESSKVESWKDELEKFENALALTREEIRSLREAALENMGEEKAQIFDAHLLLLDDPEIKKQVAIKVERESVNCAHALDEVVKQFVSIFDAMEDAYMKERVADIKDVYSRVIRNILGVMSTNLNDVSEEVIVVASDLTPSETVGLNKDLILGFATDIGGKTSHSAIMARTLEIPAIVGLHNVTEVVKTGDMLIFNGDSGELHVNPEQEVIDGFAQKKEELARRKAELAKYKGLDSVTTDGVKVKLAGNIGHIRDLDSFESNDGEAIGLYRTEFLFMDRSESPTEEDQYQEYLKVITRLKGKECLFRTFDIGGDKNVDYLDIGEEENPFLGYRAIRICLEDTELFKTQLKAMLRTSSYGKIGIMFPMISSVNELLEAKELLEQAKSELLERGEKLGEYKVGMMIEVPSAALMSDVFAKHVDFFSIGTNDLTQYTCAVDRMNENVAHLYDSYNPGLLRLINIVASNAKKNCVELAMCGSMAHDPLLVPVFVGMGFEELSMSPMHILPTRSLLRKLSFEECKNCLEKVLSLETGEKVKLYLENLHKGGL